MSGGNTLLYLTEILRNEIASSLPLTQNRPGFLQIGMAGGEQILPPPLTAICLDGPIDLELGM